MDESTRKGSIMKLWLAGPVLMLLVAIAGCAPGMGYYSGGSASATATRLSGRAVDSVITSRFDGFSHGAVFKLANGQIWQQTEYYIWGYVAVRPHVSIVSSYRGYVMHVDGIDHGVTVQRIR